MMPAHGIVRNQFWLRGFDWRRGGLRTGGLCIGESSYGGAEQRDR